MDFLTTSLVCFEFGFDAQLGEEDAHGGPLAQAKNLGRVGQLVLHVPESVR